MTRCDKSTCIVAYGYNKYPVVWYKTAFNPKIKVYYNGHKPEEWGEKWTFSIEEKSSLNIIKYKSPKEAEIFTQECPLNISRIVDCAFKYMKESAEAEKLLDLEYNSPMLGLEPAPL